MPKETDPKNPDQKQSDAPKYADPETGAPPKQIIDPMMLGALICPKTRGPLTFDRGANELISKKAKLAYPIREGVPILLIEEAREI